MPKAAPTTTTRGLSALAATLGPIEPAGDDPDALREHVNRLDILVCAAPRLPVTSPADAALALSAAAQMLSDLDADQHTEAELLDRVRDVRRVLAQIGRWMGDDLSAPPLATVWMPDASPFTALPLAGQT